MEDSRNNWEERRMEMQNEEFESILKQDWLERADVSRIRSIAGDVKLYQVVSCVNVSVPRYKVEASEYENEEGDEEEQVKAPPRGGRGARSQRMLRVALFDGTSTQLGYEYEPIGAFDSFFDANANAMTRCCVKLALYGRPVCRRGTFWLTSCNVKLLFEGYACSRYAPAGGVSQADECLLLIDSEESPLVTPTQVPEGSGLGGRAPVSPLRISSDIIELANTCFDTGDSEFELDCPPATANQLPSQNGRRESVPGNALHLDHEADRGRVQYGASLNDKNNTNIIQNNENSYTNNINRSRGEALSASMDLDTNLKEEEEKKLVERLPKDIRMSSMKPTETVPDVREYFHPKCKYLEHSFLCFLKRTGLPFNNSSFMQFARSRFSHSLGDRPSLADFCRMLNFGASTQTRDFFFSGPYSDYAFGFLNHASPVLTGDGRSASARMLRAILEKMCIFSDRNVWIAILDDCLNCSFCIFNIEMFPFIRPNLDELATSLELNALEGFFLTEELVLDEIGDYEENRVKVLRAFLTELPPEHMCQRAGVVQDEFKRIERDFRF